jgi:hypothetical protein
MAGVPLTGWWAPTNGARVGRGRPRRWRRSGLADGRSELRQTLARQRQRGGEGLGGARRSEGRRCEE